MGHCRGEDGSPIFDNLDIDLFIKVLANTAFSENYLLVYAAVIHHSLGPFFVFFIPIFYIFQGAKLTDPIIITSSTYYILVSAFCRSIGAHKWSYITDWTSGFSRWYSKLYRNQGSLLFSPVPLDWGEQVILVTGGAFFHYCQVFDTDLMYFS